MGRVGEGDTGHQHSGELAALSRQEVAMLLVRQRLRERRAGLVIRIQLSDWKESPGTVIMAGQEVSLCTVIILVLVSANIQDETFTTAHI